MTVVYEVHEDKPTIITAVNTLTTAGFVLSSATRNPGNIILHTYRYDEFGTIQKYCFLISEDLITSNAVFGAQIAANHQKETLIIVGHSEVECPHIEWRDFVNLFGGPIISSSPLEPNFSDNLIELGHNKLPYGLIGKPDDLFEIFVHAALEFILGGKVLRYGQARLFEQCPDGLAIPSPRFAALYDAKASELGYVITADTIRQFESYIKSFNAKYSAWYKLNSFIIVSSTFKNMDETLEERAQELLAKTGVPLSCLTSSTLGEIIELFKQSPLMRYGIDWSRIFISFVVKAKEVEKQINKISRDKIIKG